MRTARGPAIEEVLASSLRHESVAVRVGAVRVVTQRRLKGGADALVGLLADRDSRVQQAAVDGLRMWRTEKIITPLVAMYQDGDFSLQSKIISCLAWSISPQVVNLVTNAMSHEHEKVREAATRAIGESRPPEAFDLLSKALKDKSAWVKRAALKSLGKLDAPKATEVLLGVASDTKQHPAFRSLALTAISSKRAPTAELAILLKLATDKESSVRVEVAKLLGRGKHRAAIGALIKLLRDENRAVRISAYGSLTHIAGRRFKEIEVEKWEAWWEAQREASGAR